MCAEKDRHRYKHRHKHRHNTLHYKSNPICYCLPKPAHHYIPDEKSTFHMQPCPYTHTSYDRFTKACVLQRVAECCRVLQSVAECCSALQCAAVCCSVLQRVAACCSVLQCVAVRCRVLQCVAECCSVLKCVAVCCSVLRCVAVCCSVFVDVCSPSYLTSSDVTFFSFKVTFVCVAVCHDSFLYVPRIIFYVCYDSFLRVPWLTFMSTMSHGPAVSF